MKKIPFLMLLGIIVMLSVNSCKTGYSKGSYISSLEKFVHKVERDYSDYKDKDWQYAEERMAAYEEKYEKYADSFTREEKITVAKLMVKYKVVRAKGKIGGFLGTVTGLFETGKGVTEEWFEDMHGEIKRWTDSIESVLK